ncbi:MAG TPA: TetR family transcriptional regulator [Pseudomonas sp.]|nr:TetR family transcriptional regulator [Pseudomonas sp.]
MRRTKEDAEKTRAAILDAAERLFLERGVAHTSLEHIARAAGVTRGAVYWHFQNKADLFNAMLNQVRLPPEQIAEKLSSDPQLSVNSLRDMCILALQNLMQNEQKRQILTILMQRCEVTDELRPAMDRHNQFIQQVVDVFERLLAEAERHGQLHPGISARQAARAVHALLLGLINDLLRDPQCLDPQTDGAAIFDALFRGLIRERA